jgi:hypothetical protein
VYSLGLKSSKAAGSFGTEHSDQLGTNFARVQELYLQVETAHLLAEGSAESNQDHLPTGLFPFRVGSTRDRGFSFKRERFQRERAGCPSLDGDYPFMSPGKLMFSS